MTTIGMAATALGLSSCATAPKLLPAAQVDQMGAQAWAQTQAQTPELKDPAARSFVQEVAQRIIQASPEAQKVAHWDVEVFDSPEINAFALPGGHIGVYAGILPVAANAAGLAAVLGHEVGHVIAEHSNKRVSQALIAQGAMGLASVALGQNPHSDMILGALGLGTQVGVLLPYGRDQESEADRIGLELMARAGYDPSEAVTFWGRMKQSASGEPPEFLSTHPATDKRIAQLKSLLPKAEGTYQAAPTKLGLGPSAPASMRASAPSRIGAG